MIKPILFIYQPSLMNFGHSIHSLKKEFVTFFVLFLVHQGAVKVVAILDFNMITGIDLS